jgi:hypothetical protein
MGQDLTTVGTATRSLGNMEMNTQISNWLLGAKVASFIEEPKPLLVIRSRLKWPRRSSSCRMLYALRRSLISIRNWVSR